MFIPLTINQRREGLQNVLIAGDTAGIFYLLSHLTALELNVFLADTGISRPLREFPCHRGASKDRANVYYDFFDGGIGAGIPRRMDAVLTTSCDLKRWTRRFEVPAVHLWQDASGTWLEFEGTAERPKKDRSATCSAPSLPPGARMRRNRPRPCSIRRASCTPSRRSGSGRRPRPRPASRRSAPGTGPATC